MKRAKIIQRVWEITKKEVLRHDKEKLHRPDVIIRVCGVVYAGFSKRFEASRQRCDEGAGKCVVMVTCRELKMESRGYRFGLMYGLDQINGLWRHFVGPSRAMGGWRGQRRRVLNRIEGCLAPFL